MKFKDANLLRAGDKCYGTPEKHTPNMSSSFLFPHESTQLPQGKGYWTDESSAGAFTHTQTYIAFGFSDSTELDFAKNKKIEKKKEKYSEFLKPTKWITGFAPHVCQSRLSRYYTESTHCLLLLFFNLMHYIE